LREKPAKMKLRMQTGKTERARDCQKRGKACRDKHRSPVKNRHPMKIIRSILESYILIPG
jgi:hypothetical protein